MYFDKLAIFCRDQIEIDRDGFVFFVVKIDNRVSVKHAGADAGDQFSNWRRVHFFFPGQFATGNGNGEAGTGNRGGARPTVGLKHIAIDPNGARAEFFKIDDCA